MSKAESDMDPDISMNLVREDDGDIILYLRDEKIGDSLEVQFCASGGKFPNTLRALAKVMDAIEQDRKWNSGL